MLSLVPHSERAPVRWGEPLFTMCPGAFASFAAVLYNPAMTRDWIGWCLFVPGIALSLWYYSPSLHLHAHLSDVGRWIKSRWAQFWNLVRTVSGRAWLRLRRAMNRLLGRSTVIEARLESVQAVSSTMVAAYQIHPSGPEAIEALYAAVDTLRTDTTKWQADHLEEHEQERQRAEGAQHRSAWIGFAGLALVTTATIVWNLPR
jgi:hypothetical protein